MKEIGYGKDYRYAHDYPEALVNRGYFPSELRDRIYYRPTNRGYERVIKERLDKARKILAQMLYRQNSREKLFQNGPLLNLLIPKLSG